EQDVGALCPCHARPRAFIESLAGGRDGAFGIGPGAGRVTADHDAVAGRHALERAAGAFRPDAIDQHAEIACLEVVERLRFHMRGHHHSPLNSAGRFPVKAATPSLRSPVLATRMEPSASTAAPLSSPFATEIISL